MTKIQELTIHVIECKNEAEYWLQSIRMCDKMIGRLKREHQAIQDQISILQLQDMVNNDQTNNV